MDEKKTRLAMSWLLRLRAGQREAHKLSLGIFLYVGIPHNTSCYTYTHTHAYINALKEIW